MRCRYLDLVVFCRYSAVMGKKRGRPTKRPPARRGELLQVRLQPLEKQVFADAAELCGQDVSVWVRDVLRRAAREKIVEVGRGDPFSATPNTQNV
jgi:hypothetical protein